MLHHCLVQGLVLSDQDIENIVDQVLMPAVGLVVLHRQRMRDDEAGRTLRGMDRQRVRRWVADYERAWRASGTTALAEIFTADATYQQAPYLEPVSGLPAIARMWEAERSADEIFEMSSEVVAVDGDTAVVRVEVRYQAPVRQEYRDLWIARFAADGRCRAFEEWPFWPDKSYRADG
ncbi:hypothetical protein GCM10011581_27820 [Saccharopolyspora subtropica]|uniref:SnoaL-like domain-containing protein n=1 Tax=Saccharopolyspora thermophila TaxID=89367 RepID=A0A917JWA1_9PSEU|nr:nuclear transport factor 2 family protein [Saccharopolyspora subtropica]GGI89147.1 hypothetical protein GCM10011581_27820 [Saccharopolyspora subtropica]